MTDKLRILVTGFGPFPGAPYNPTMPLVQRLTQLRRPAFGDVELISHIFHVTYATVDRELPELIAQYRPHALLMFGLAERTRHVRVETRARNAVTTRFPDADRNRARKGSIVGGGTDAMMFGPHTAKLLRAAVSTGIDARASRDAGSYLCNYLSWRAIEATCGNGPRLAAFVHIPLLARDSASPRKGAPHPVTLEQLIDAGEAMLLELVRLTRQAVRENTTPAAISPDGHDR